MDNDYDYSIGFGGKAPPPNPEDREKAMKLVEDSFGVLTKSLQLRQEAERNTLDILQLCEKYRDVNPDDLEWEEKEKLYGEIDRLTSKWKEVYEKLKALDEEYEEVRLRVNAHYGTELMPKRKLYPSRMEKMFEDMFGDDEGDWWKK